MTTGLLLVAHGSPIQVANQDLFLLVEQLRCRCDYEVIEPAFLEGAMPSIPDGIAACVDKGVRRVVIIPYFLLPGKHVAEDLPRFVEHARRQHAEVEFVLAEPLRFSHRLGQAVLRRIEEANVLQWKAETAERGERHGSDGDV
ncbi:sirohydrochlorin chelatase [Tumebacillus lipolyticus]|uniref:Sirohydrochlorin chelatase n=1 Tax=Tumebacillus lipolyticus TaxID=1280370 RepID=A0ABW4ZTN4_9BACL